MEGWSGSGSSESAARLKGGTRHNLKTSLISFFYCLWYNFLMNVCKINVLIDDGASLPVYQTCGAAGCDVRAFLPDSDIVLKPGKRVLVPTGLKMEIPEGFEIQVRPRSGLAIKNGITCLNTPGTIESDYRGEIKVILINLGDEDFIIKNGDRIAQLVVSPVTRGEFFKADFLEETERSDGGFGHTGK